MNEKKIKKYTNHILNEIRKAWNISKKEWKWIMGSSEPPRYKTYYNSALEQLMNIQLDFFDSTFSSFKLLFKNPKNNEEKENE